MNVCYFAVGPEHAEMAEMAAEALRLFHPDWPAYVLTDRDTQFKTLKPVRGFTSPATLIYDRTIAQYHFVMEMGEALFLDSDCLVNRPLDGFMEGPVGLTHRKNPPKQAQGMDFNCGVVYASGKLAQAFWSHWVDVFHFIQRDAWAWYGDQVVLPELVKEYSGWCRIYDCETHNYTFAHTGELRTILPAYIVHFKGKKRKDFIPQYLDLLRAKYGAEDLRRSA